MSLLAVHLICTFSVMLWSSGVVMPPFVEHLVGTGFSYIFPILLFLFIYVMIGCEDYLHCHPDCVLSIV